MTALIQLEERVYDAIVTRLKAGLGAAIDQINAADTKGFTIERNVLVLDYVPTPRELNVFPTVALQDGPTDMEDDTGEGGTAVCSFNLVCFYLHADQRQLAVGLRRYRQAAASVALEGRAFGPIWSIQFMGTIPGPTLGRGEDPREWMSYCGIALECKAETLPGT